MATLLDHFQAHLIARGIARKPGSAGAGHPLYKEPGEGTPTPGDPTGTEADATIVLGCMRSTGIPVGSHQSWYRQDCVEIVYRLRHARDLDAIEFSVRGEFADRRAWTMLASEPVGVLPVIESSVWRECQRLGSDKRSITFNQVFLFQTYTGQAPRDGV